MCQCVRIRGVLTIIVKKGSRSPLHTSCGLSTSSTAEASLPLVSSLQAPNHYKIVMFSKTNFQGDQGAVEPLALLFPA